MKCTFCRIINEEEKAFTIYSSDYVMAFLDKYPVSRGHTLVVPKEHYETYIRNTRSYSL
ncbi:MAG: hypothetical protein DRJ44_03170 [Thermoprotei archaeon]|nr:MAG: hypothetical protein DRJ44_03170 [Thermoprotei archaeon]